MPRGGRHNLAAAPTRRSPPMPQVPGSLAELVSLFAGCFTQPTFRTFRALLVGFIARVGEHTITGCLVACGAAGGWYHSRGHRFFSRARWSPDRLGLVLLDLIVARLIDPGAPLLIAIDDTRLRRSGRRVWGTAWHHEPTGTTPRSFAWAITGWWPRSSCGCPSWPGRWRCRCCSGCRPSTRTASTSSPHS